MLPETMNLIDTALGWEPGTVRSLARDLKPADTASREAAQRQRLIAYVASLRPEQLSSALAYFENIDQDAPLSRADLDAFKEGMERLIAEQVDAAKEQIVASIGTTEPTGRRRG